MVLSPQVCFVCGGAGAVQSLCSRPVNKSPHFPFLESHEPPKGARAPSKGGVVDSCNICYMFLHQQWNSYEKARTPLVKRLYWLKRVDNRPFTGAEMRMQGEYAAQMMGLQYYPSNAGTMSPYEYSPGDSEQAKSKLRHHDALDNTALDDSRDTSHAANESDGLILDDTCKSGSALDLSNVSVKEEADCKAPQKLDCPTCNKVFAVDEFVLVTEQFVSESQPFFPFLVQLDKRYRVDDDKGYRVCCACGMSLNEQWNYFNIKQVPIQQRMYSFDRDAQFKFASQEQTKVDEQAAQYNVCYLCGQSYNRLSMKMLHTRPPLVKNSKHSIYFPFVCELRRPESAQPLDHYGRVVSCRACYSYLQRQWQSYQQDGTPVEERKFMLRPANDSDSFHTSFASSPNQSSSYFDDSVKSEEGPAELNPLNVQISSSDKIESQGVHTHSQGLLAIAPHAPAQMLHPGYMYSPSSLRASDVKVSSLLNQGDRRSNEERGDRASAQAERWSERDEERGERVSAQAERWSERDEERGQRASAQGERWSERDEEIDVEYDRVSDQLVINFPLHVCAC